MARIIFRSWPSARASWSTGGDTCSNRNDQRVFIQAGGDFAKHFNHDAWFNGGKNDVGDLRYFLRRFCGVDAELVMQDGDFIRGRGIYPDLPWKRLTAGNQTAENGFSILPQPIKPIFFSIASLLP